MRQLYTIFKALSIVCYMIDCSFKKYFIEQQFLKVVSDNINIRIYYSKLRILL